MKASDRQVSGNHYKDFPIQPAEFCQRNRLNWCEANVVKYTARHAKKNGLEDLRKAMHYLELLAEFEYGTPLSPSGEGSIKAERKASLCHSCDHTVCTPNLVTACEDSGTCGRYVSALRERTMAAKEEAAKADNCVSHDPRICVDCHLCPIYAKEEAPKPAPVALEICPSCDQHPGCKGQYPPVTEDGSCNGFSAKRLTRYEIWQKIETENARSKSIHGMWKDVPNWKQVAALAEEFREWQDAYAKGDVDGEHGEVAELIQLANLCFRRVQFLKGEADA